MIHAYIILFISIFVESFPVSSSGHIYLVQSFLQKFEYICLNQWVVSSLEYISNGFTALILAAFFVRRWFFLLKNCKRFLPIIGKIFVLGFITDGITLCFFGLFYVFDMPFVNITIGFMITTIALFSLRFCSSSRNATWNSKNAVLIGIAQGFALLPGISRFGLTFVSARCLGFSSRRAFELSFLLEWPICVAACFFGLKTFYEHSAFDLLNFPALLSMISASVMAFIGLQIVWALIQHDRLWFFSGYTAILVLILMVI